MNKSNSSAQGDIDLVPELCSESCPSHHPTWGAHSTPPIGTWERQTHTVSLHLELSDTLPFSIAAITECVPSSWVDIPGLISEHHFKELCVMVERVFCIFLFDHLQSLWVLCSSWSPFLSGEHDSLTHCVSLSFWKLFLSGAWFIPYYLSALCEIYNSFWWDCFFFLTPPFSTL